MIVRLVAATVVAGAVLLTAWGIQRARGRPMPRSAWPLLLAASLIGYGVYDEYSWRSRTVAALPASAVVVGEGASRSVLSPWALALPRIDRLSVVDRAAVRTHPEHPDLRLAEVVLLERLHSTLRVEEIVDCANGRAAVLGASPEFGDDGLPVGVRWTALEPGDAHLDAACGKLTPARSSASP